jgi:hypothetical protein
LKKANYAEDNYVIFSNGQVLDDTENFAYDQKIYKLWSLNKGFALPGLLGDESMDQISEWYENLDQYGKEYFGAISSGALDEYADWQTFAKDSYGYHDISTAKAGYYGEWKSTDWEMLKKIADGALI